MLTNLVQQLYSMVDLAVIGQCVGTLGTIGVNTGGEIADQMCIRDSNRLRSVGPDPVWS